ncbi:MAG: tetraacyldisaccharide 4'-kinase [Betaproteobacteria bacterium]
MTLADRLVALWYSPRPSPVTILLWPFSLVFRTGVALRRALYRVGILSAARLPVPVVVVGNITVGGSGKTPLVAALARALRERGYQPGIVSRGFGRNPGDGAPIAVVAGDDPGRVGDEPLLLARAGYPVVVARDRVAAARELLVRNPACDVILADDGLQHYRLPRRFEIAVVDAARALGNGWLLPAGPLREPESRLDEVDAVVTLRDGGGGEPTPATECAFTMTLAAGTFARVGDARVTTSAPSFAGAHVHAVAGIGNPARFFRQLGAMGIEAIPHAFPDHHRFVPADLAFVGARSILMTEKDAVKCEAFADERCWYLPVHARVDDALVTLIEERLRGSQTA